MIFLKQMNKLKVTLLFRNKLKTSYYEKRAYSLTMDSNECAFFCRLMILMERLNVGSIFQLYRHYDKIISNNVQYYSGGTKIYE